MQQWQSSLPSCSLFCHLNHHDSAAGGVTVLTQVNPLSPWRYNLFLRRLVCAAFDGTNLKSPVSHQAASSNPPLLTWKVAQKKLPWGIVLLLGGGFALAKGSEVSGSPDVNGYLRCL